MPKSYARIDALTATEANQAIIFRRGPRDHTQMLVWDFNTDEVTPGQWINSRVFTRRSDVSPDGKYIAYFARGRGDYVPQHPKSHQPEALEDTYIAISRPPFYSAIGLWFCIGSYGGGGIWKDNLTFHAHPDPYSFRQALAPPDELQVIRREWIQESDACLLRMKLLARGWQSLSAPHNISTSQTYSNKLSDLFRAILKVPIYTTSKNLGIQTNWTLEKLFAGGTILYTYGWKSEHASVIDSKGAEQLSIETKEHHPLWIDTDASGRLVYADKGCLYAWKDFPKGKPQLIADLNPNTFENIPPPDWALKP